MLVVLLVLLLLLRRCRGAFSILATRPFLCRHVPCQWPECRGSQPRFRLACWSFTRTLTLTLALLALTLAGGTKAKGWVHVTRTWRPSWLHSLPRVLPRLHLLTLQHLLRLRLRLHLAVLWQLWLVPKVRIGLWHVRLTPRLMELWI